jgi:hypothetical protein
MIKILVKFFRTEVWEMIMYEMSCHGHVTMMVSQSACPGVEPLLELMTSILCVLHESVYLPVERSVMIIHVCPLSEATLCIFTYLHNWWYCLSYPNGQPLDRR